MRWRRSGTPRVPRLLRRTLAPYDAVIPSLAAIVPATDSPQTLGRCLAAIAAADHPPDEVIVVSEPRGLGPAGARNAGARRAGADVLVFVDADTEVHPDAFARLRAAFAGEDPPAAVFGSYDDRPPAPGAVSAFRNLLHHHVHQHGAGPATTFWAGLGAVRRDVFEEHGGFDETAYPRPSVEDIELGSRIARAGERITLDARLQATHLKAWSLSSMVVTDLRDRAVPWLLLVVQGRADARALNLGRRHRFSAGAVVVAAGCAVARRPFAALAAAGAFVALNRDFYALLANRRGLRTAASGVVLHAVHHLTGVVAVPVAAVELVRSVVRRG